MKYIEPIESVQFFETAMVSKQPKKKYESMNFIQMREIFSPRVHINTSLQ